MRWLAAALLLGLGLLAGVPIAGAEDSGSLGAEEAEALVRARWIEGLPEDEARRIDSAGAARLIELLEDPAERKIHANVLLALGLCGAPGALEALDGWADIPREGEVDRATFRAWQALPFALGHLADRDRRALARLEHLLEGEDPGWHFRHHRGARLVRESRRAAATSLAWTGLPEAAPLLERAGQRVSDPAFEAHLESMRALRAARDPGVAR